MFEAMPEMTPEQSLLEANGEFYLAFSSLTIERMDAVWSKDEFVVCVHPGWPPLHGWEAVRESWVRIFENTESMNLVLADTRITIEDKGRIGHVELIENIRSETAENETVAPIAARNSFHWFGKHWLMTSHVAVPV